MEFIQRTVKIQKSKCYKRIQNVNGLHLELYGAAKVVGVFYVTKELKDSYAGLLGSCTHEEYKAGDLTRLTLEDIVCD